MKVSLLLRQLPMQSAGQEEISLRQLIQGVNTDCVPLGPVLWSYALPQALWWSLHNSGLDSQLDKGSRASSAQAWASSAQSSSSIAPHQIQQRRALTWNETTMVHCLASGKLWKRSKKKTCGFLVWGRICNLHLFFSLPLPVTLFLFLPVEQWVQ